MTDDDDVSNLELTGLPDVIDAIIGVPIPKPVKTSLWKSFHRLSTAIVDIPVAYLEGFADERRAESEARKRLIDNTAKKISEGMEFEEEYSQAAVKKYGERILREQVNIDRILKGAVEDIKSGRTTFPKESEAVLGSDKIISDDFLDHFRREAAPQNSEEMQAIFSRILAGESAQPGAFSIKTLRTVGELDRRTAATFQRFCSLCISARIPNGPILDVRIPTLGKSAGTNGLQKYGFGFNMLNKLHESGLIISDFNSYCDYRTSLVDSDKKVSLPFDFQGMQYAFKAKTDSDTKELNIHGVGTTNIGKELFSIVDQTPAHGYFEDLKQYMDKKGFIIVHVSPAS